MYTEKLQYNPDRYKCLDSSAAYYNFVFGEGLFQKKFGMPKKSDSKAEPWDIS